MIILIIRQNLSNLKSNTDKFEIIKQLGRGKYSEVYLGINKEDD